MTGDCNAAFISDPDFTLYQGDALETLRRLPAESVHTCVTSPPYFGLRDYGSPAQIGLEETPEEYVAALVAVFAEVRRVLAAGGTLWLNLGDTYSQDTKWGGSSGNKNELKQGYPRPRKRGQTGLKPKDLIGIPWRVAFALQADGWYLRSDIVWSKPNPMPESVTDRPTKSHEYLFLLSKSARYFYDAEAIAEPASWYGPNGQPKAGPHAGQMRGRAGRKQDKLGEIQAQMRGGDTKTGFNDRWSAAVANGDAPLTRNARSVWTIQTQQYADAHFAVYPEEIPRRCIAAGCPEDGTVLDPFMGSGTTALVARRLGRRCIGIELNPVYARLAADRLSQLSLLAEASA